MEVGLEREKLLNLMDEWASEFDEQYGAFMGQVGPD